MRYRWMETYVQVKITVEAMKECSGKLRSKYTSATAFTHNSKKDVLC